MGCGESKHAVAVENTITREKSNAGSRRSKDITTVNGTGKEGSSVVVKREESKCIRNDGNVSAVAEEKEITENKELKGGKEIKKEYGGIIEENQETGRLISKESPNRFFSSRREEDVDGSSASEGKSEFFSPRVESGKESFFNDSVKLDDVVEDKLVQETQNESSATVKEEDMDKEAKAAGISIEAEVAIPAVQHMTREEALTVHQARIGRQLKGTI
ncbi:hypothetical protein JCGZ_02014 [Jatropha curcas]|uniref:Uncharacterized protein n=1 Tax=Jatropha curcas TaxID=180498 RepID=A0A067KUW8_JATCU|nr:uncharacterized protein LOC110009273 isoform X2 [Jatropha curcas]KDP40016.1 hypothetical protein JCGZ_02014 [Jatropha curcas]